MAGNGFSPETFSLPPKIVFLYRFQFWAGGFKARFWYFRRWRLAVAKNPRENRIDVFGVVGHVKFFVDFFDGQGFANFFIGK